MITGTQAWTNGSEALGGGVKKKDATHAPSEVFLPELELDVFGHEGPKANEGKDEKDAAAKVPDKEFVGQQSFESLLQYGKTFLCDVISFKDIIF